MTAQETKKRAGARRGRREQGFYVYCIAERDALTQAFEDKLPAAIEEGAALEVVAENELAAVTSAVPLAEYGEEALQERLRDATWTAVRAMRHERVVEHFARCASVVPLRFGAIYLGRDRVERMLAEKLEALRAIIERLRGREEWGLNIYYQRAQLLKNIVSLSPRLRAMSAEAEAASPGQSYLMRKKIDALREQEARAEIKRMAARLESELSGYADSVARLRVLKDEAGEHGELAAKLAFLVERERFDEFRQAAEELAAELSSAGFKIELTGPWPAYNFAAGEG